MAIDQPVDLPLELFRPILLHLRHDYQSLSRFCLCSKYLHSEAERLLYSEVTHLRDAADSSTGLSERRHSGFLNTIIANPRLAAFVDAYAQESLAKYKEGFLWRLTYDGLRAMVNLKRLTFSTRYRHPNSPLILLACSPRLEHLTWGSGHFYDLDSQLLARLDRFHSLKSLSVVLYRIVVGEEKVLPCVPSLTELVGNWEAVSVFLPGRRVTTLSITPSNAESQLNHQLIEHLSPELSEIQRLKAGYNFLKLCSPAELLRSLRVLAWISGSHKIDIIKSQLKDVIDMVTLIPTLRVLIVTGLEICDDFNESSKAFFALMLHRKCPSVDFVDFQVDRETYERWVPSKGLRSGTRSLEKDDPPWEEY